MRVTIINGPSGVGKSTAIEKLRQEIDTQVLIIDVDRVRKLISNFRDDVERATEWTAQNVVHMAKTAIEDGYDVVLDKVITDHTTPVQRIWRAMLDDLNEIAKQHQTELKEIILTADASVVRERFAERAKGSGREINEAEVSGFIEGIELRKQLPHTVVIDTTHLNPDEVVQELIKVIK